MSNRKRVGDDVVSKALVEAGGNLTMQELATKLEMKETTLRAQVTRIKEKVTKAKVASNQLDWKFPTPKDGRGTSSVSNVEALVDIFS